jgi:hypothetical protein
MSKEEQINHIHQQVCKGLLVASENMLAFKRYKQTPVVIVREGQVVEVSPNQLQPTKQAAA